MLTGTTTVVGTSAGLSQGQDTTTPKEPRILMVFMDNITDCQTHAVTLEELLEGDFLAVL